MGKIFSIDNIIYITNSKCKIHVIFLHGLFFLFGFIGTLFEFWKNSRLTQPFHSVWNNSNFLIYSKYIFDFTNSNILIFFQCKHNKNIRGLFFFWDFNSNFTTRAKNRFFYPVRFSRKFILFWLRVYTNPRRHIFCIIRTNLGNCNISVHTTGVATRTF